MNRRPNPKARLNPKAEPSRKPTIKDLLLADEPRFGSLEPHRRKKLKHRPPVEFEQQDKGSSQRITIRRELPVASKPIAPP